MWKPMNIECDHIFRQLKGHKLKAMLGCDILHDNDANALILANIKSRYCTHIKIMLMDNDTYDVKVLKVRGYNLKHVALVEGVMCNQLLDTIKHYTRMEISL